MAEYVEKNLLLFHIAGVKSHIHGDSDWINGYRDALQAVGELTQKFPAADVAPVKHGGCDYCRGKAYTDKPFKVITQLGKEVEVKFYYCPNCGAKMDLEG